MDYVILNNGIKMPMQGFGVYGNEHAVGTTISKSGIACEKIFITTKAWISEMGHDNTLRAFDASLSRLGLEYLDLYLIHMPFGDYHGAWRAMGKINGTDQRRVYDYQPAK